LIKDNKIIPTDVYGNRKYSEQQYLIKDDKVIPIDLYGNRQYNKPQFVIKGEMAQKPKP
jgi:hypothetical protein